jgi:hypothetical protein
MNNNNEYNDFLQARVVAAAAVGFDVAEDALNPQAFQFQRDIVRWALRRGRAAIFAGCGLGKTLMQLDWAANVHRHTGGDVLILCPLAVARQTEAEGQKFGVPVQVCRTQKDVRPGVNIANYEMLSHFDTGHFAGVVLDESGILKSYMGKTKQALIEAFSRTPYRLCCTATPAPNDHLELGNHAQFLGIMDSNEMISRWFINDTMQAGGYRLKGHAESDYWRWVATWAVCIAKPSDLGYDDAGFALPALRMHHHPVDVDVVTGAADGEIFRDGKLTATSMHREMRMTAGDRADAVARIVATDPDGTWLIWCNTDYEADAIRERVPAAVEVRGSQSPELKAGRLEDFAFGRSRMLLTKPRIGGWGLNLQCCHQMVFVGLSYSFEQFYQAVRRCWRFGQTKPVDVHIVAAITEGAVLKAVQDKEAEHERMQAAMIEAMKAESLSGLAKVRTLRMDVDRQVATGDGWELHLDDCCEHARRIEADTLDFSVFSPPFSNLYIYSDSVRDMGNAEDDAEFMRHFEFLIGELYRATVPGRLCSVHCKDLPLYKGRDGAAGLRDFPGAIIAAFERHGWTYHSRVTIWKDPVIEMQRTKNHGLLYKQLCKDSAASRQGMADYLITFRKWTEAGEFPRPVTTGGERFDRYVGLQPPPRGMDARLWSIEVWQRYASPVWMDIDQTNVLNYQIAKDARDEKHICPLQLDVIERAIHLWTNPGDLVYSPFTGIGSEGYVALKLGRRFIGSELKPAYFQVAARNLERAARERQESAKSLFNMPA